MATKRGLWHSIEKGGSYMVGFRNDPRLFWDLVVKEGFTEVRFAYSGRKLRLRDGRWFVENDVAGTSHEVKVGANV